MFIKPQEPPKGMNFSRFRSYALSRSQYYLYNNIVSSFGVLLWACIYLYILKWRINYENSHGSEENEAYGADKRFYRS